MNRNKLVLLLMATFVMTAQLGLAGGVAFCPSRNCLSSPCCCPLSVDQWGKMMESTFGPKPYIVGGDELCLTVNELCQCGPVPPGHRHKWDESFEDYFPLDSEGRQYWFHGDANPANGEVSWGRVSCESSTGLHSVWCAAENGPPLCSTYVGEMDSYMYVEGYYWGLREEGTNYLYFDYKSDTEANFDRLEVIVQGFERNPGHGVGEPMVIQINNFFPTDGAWKTGVVKLNCLFGNYDACVPEGRWVRIIFNFHSDDSIVSGPGAYVDNVIFDKRDETRIAVFDGGFPAPIPDDQYETNNLMGDAFDLGSTFGWLRDKDGEGVQKNADWYKVTMPPGHNRMWVDFRYWPGDRPMKISLFDQYGAGIAESTGNNGFRLIDKSISTAGGDYFLLVDGDNTGGQYDFWWGAFSQADDCREYNDTQFAAADFFGSWDCDGIQRNFDWYRFPVTGDETRIQVTVNFTHADGDIDVCLFNENGDQLDCSVGTVDSETLDVTVPEEGTYYLLIFGEDAGNLYSVDVDQSVPPPPPPEPLKRVVISADSVECGMTFDSTLQVIEPVGLDFFQIKIKYNPSILEVVSASLADSLDGWITTTLAQSEGEITLLAREGFMGVGLSESSDLLYIQFRCRPESCDSRSLLRLEAPGYDFKTESYTLYSTGVECGAGVLLGDYNGDGVVTPQDAEDAYQCYMREQCQPLVNIGMGDISPDSAPPCVGIEDGDTVIAPGDAQRLIKLAVGTEQAATGDCPGG